MLDECHPHHNNTLKLAMQANGASQTFAPHDHTQAPASYYNPPQPYDGYSLPLAYSVPSRPIPSAPVPTGQQQCHLAMPQPTVPSSATSRQPRLAQTATRPLMETYYGVIENVHDALLVFEACRLGYLNRVQRRLSEKERRALRSGSVFVWDEEESGMRRWTDGRIWSPSRVLGSFLTYRELDARKSSTRRPMPIIKPATSPQSKPVPCSDSVPLTERDSKKADAEIPNEESERENVADIPNHENNKLDVALGQNENNKLDVPEKSSKRLVPPDSPSSQWYSRPQPSHQH